MDNINFYHFRNDFISYPSNFCAKQKSVSSLIGKDILKADTSNIDKEISAYLDILYNDNDESKIKNLNSAYSPMRSSSLHYGEFFI